MAELITQQKRLREEESNEPEITHIDSKRQKSYNNILSLLDEEEEEQEPSQDLSAILTNLQKEISPAPEELSGADEEESLESVMRHLLEASDDELGIPNRDGEEDGDDGFEKIWGENCNYFGNGLWEIEDDAANYYTVLQSELFM